MNNEQKLIQELRAHQGRWISGEELSQRIGISRQAIHKHISRLRTDGYHIDAYTRKGYRLDLEPEVINEQEIQNGLKTQVLGHRIICYPIIDSTNVVARKQAEKGAPEGTLVVADSQTQGRGRRGRSWSSPKGDGIYMSIVLRPNMVPDQAMKITLAAGVAAAKAISSETGQIVHIKWPNDLQINGKKIAGILTEVSTEMDLINYLILGIGINVNTPKKRFDPEVTDVATSLAQETGKSFSRVRIIQAFLKEMENYYQMLVEGNFSEILNEWKLLSNTIGRQVSVMLIDRSYTGTAIDVDDEGRLIVEDLHGDVHRLLCGDVSIR